MIKKWAKLKKSAAIVVAAGTGSRTGMETPKQFALLAGKPVLLWSAEAFGRHPAINTVVVVVSKDNVAFTQKLLSSTPNVLVVAGGKERSDSVKNAFRAIEDDAPDYVFIHDAARPGLNTQTLDDLFEALDQFDGAAPAIPVVDALKRQTESKVIENVDRTDLFRIQTPQAFRYQSIKDAQQESTSNHVDDFSIASEAGLKLTLTNGSERLHKITYKEDFKRMAETLSSHCIPRIGSGFDVHAFEDGSSVILCGVEIPHTRKLKGHSDADVAWHALTDAIYGALAAGDIGVHFPPSDAQWKGAPSSTFLDHANTLAKKQGFLIGNVDITLICEAPKISPHVKAMRTSTAELLNTSPESISIKATTTEALGFTGRGEGIAAQASVLLVANSSTDSPE